MIYERRVKASQGDNHGHRHCHLPGKVTITVTVIVTKTIRDYSAIIKATVIAAPAPC